MSDIIRLLPDHVANQIAAGEVVQRPSSVVKELLENSIDAGATVIKLFIKDGGTQQIQIIDNGKGMSETDARLCWERHATSKINQAQDLFSLSTFGFRGEAMASIAAVAQVELKTKRANDEIGTHITIEGSKVLEHSLCATPTGTNISVKNLFYNIPARRNFLKSISVETRHIMEEFQRMAIAYPQIEFHFYNNEKDVYQLKSTTLDQRICEVIGTKMKTSELLEVEEETEIVNIKGYIGAVEIAKRTRGEQYFFANGRFIKSPYFLHAVQSAYENMLPDGAYPFVALFLEVNPAKIDVNIHPTKTEVKFEDEKHIYNILKSTVRKSLGNYVLQLDADLFGMGGIEESLQKSKEEIYSNSVPDNFSTTKNERIVYNPFGENYSSQQRKKEWANFFGKTETEEEVEVASALQQKLSFQQIQKTDIYVQELFNYLNHYWVTLVNEALYIVDKKAAHEHVLFHRFKKSWLEKRVSSQQLLFPSTVELNGRDALLAFDLLEDLTHLGFDIQHFGGNTFIINALPAEMQRGNEAQILESLIQEFADTQQNQNMSKEDKLALKMAKMASIQRGDIVNKEMATLLVTELFGLENSNITQDGYPIKVVLSNNLVYDLFRKNR